MATAVATKISSSSLTGLSDSAAIKLLVAHYGGWKHTSIADVQSHMHRLGRRNVTRKHVYNVYWKEKRDNANQQTKAANGVHTPVNRISKVFKPAPEPGPVAEAALESPAPDKVSYNAEIGADVRVETIRQAMTLAKSIGISLSQMRNIIVMSQEKGLSTAQFCALLTEFQEYTELVKEGQKVGVI